MVIDKLISNIEQIDLAETISESIHETREAFKDEQIDQLKHGMNSQGEKIGKYKNPKYAQTKHLMNSAAGLGNVDARLTGSFYQGIFIDARNDVIVVESGDSKSGQLQDKYKFLLGLGGEYKAEYISVYMAPVAVKKFQDQILSP